LVLLLLFLIPVLTMVAFAVDAGRIVLLRSEIQNAVDAGALAAQLQLQLDSRDVEAAERMAQEFVRINQVGSKIVPEDSIDVEIGVWYPNTKSFTATGVEPNAVHVFARQDDEPYSFGRVLGYDTFGVPATAIATSSTREKQDIMMVLDLSGSMAYEGRIEALRAAAPVFVDVIDEAGGDDQIGVMGLSADPSDFDPQKSGHSNEPYDSNLHPTPGHHVGVLEYPLTKNFSMLKNSGLGKPKLFAGKYNGWTGTGAALGDAAHYLVNGAESRSDAKRIIVLMSDGHANRPAGNGPGYARQMAVYAAGHEITVYTISLGNSADLELMAEIAAIAGGKHFDAQGAGSAVLIPALTDAFEKVASEIKSTQLVK
jgi:Flp pilus assembly protein TadG